MRGDRGVFHGPDPADVRGMGCFISDCGCYARWLRCSKYRSDMPLSRTERFKLKSQLLDEMNILSYEVSTERGQGHCEQRRWFPARIVRRRIRTPHL